MAKPLSIAWVGEAVAQLLNRQWQVDGVEDAGNRPRVAQDKISQVLTIKDIKDPPTQHGVGLFLYRVAINGPQRNCAARTDSKGIRFRASLPVDLQYLLVPWGISVDSQLEILGWAMRTLEDSAILPAGLLNAAANDSKMFLPSECVELIIDPLNMQDQTQLWQALQQPWRVSVGYVARMVALDSRKTIGDAAPVRVRQIEHVTQGGA